MHHACYIEGSASLFGAYKEALAPYYARQYERFGIDEARELVGIAGLKNYAQPVFLLGVSSITSEAQQALLKLFEEPQQGTMFVLLVPHGVLLPTLRSRMMEYPEKLNLADKKILGSPAQGSPDYFSQQASVFLKSLGKERGDFITKLLKDDEGTRERVRDFINALEAELYKKVDSADARQALSDIALVRDYLRDRSPSLKMLLEHLALSLPNM
jgi:hypothetical protein